MAAKHTPGPWIVRESPKPNIEGPELRLSIKHTSPGRDGAEFCEIVAGHVTAEADAIARANARLIAAAPDLLAALESLVKWMDDSGLSSTTPGGVGQFHYEGTEYSVVTDARTAITKAKGE